MKKKPMNDDIENVGIMQGFMDSMGDEDEDEYGEDEDESRPEMERRPNSPEILMNNLRGDMRSIDARRDELADLVGYAAATETPEPVLAMLQPILAQQGGLGALPQSQPMAQGPQAPMAAPDMAAMGGPAPMGDVGAPMGGPLPPGGIADMMGAAGAPPMPPGAGMPPPPAAPIGMARGGYVQHFQAGSDEEGVTPAGQSPSGDLMLYPPELVQAARTQMQGLLNQQPQTVPTLGALMEKRLPEYQKLLGTDKGRGNAEAQMLLELGQRAFNFASNTDDAGRPLRGGFAARLAGAVKTLPGAMGKHIEAMNNIDLKLKSLALQASEKDQDQVVAQNTELLKRKATVFGDILKAQAKVDAERMKGLGASVFGKGDWEWNVVNMPGLMERYAAGQTDDKENNLINSAITKFKTPRFETHFHPVSKQPYTKQMPVMIPDFVTAAEASRKKLNLPVSATPALAPPGTAVVPATSGGGTASGTPTAALGEADGVTPSGATSLTPTSAPASGELPQVSLWKERFNISGPVSAAIGFVSGIPGMGDPAAHITLARQQAQQQAERIIDSLMKSTAGSVKEQERLRPVIGIIPSATLDPDTYGTKLIALGSTLQDMIREYDAQGRSKDLKPEDVGFALKRAMDLRRQYNMLGLPPVAYTQADADRLYKQGVKEILWQGRTAIKRD